MPTSLEEIQYMLNSRDIDNEIVGANDYLLTGSATLVYVDIDGVKGVSIVIEIEEKGKFIKIIAPNLYQNIHAHHEMAVLQTCMQITRHMKMIQCYYNESNSEIRLAIDIALEDHSFSSNQLMRALSCVVDAADTFDPCFRSAMSFGEVTVSAVLDKRQKKSTLVRLTENSSDSDIEHPIQ